ncbi:MAG: ABC transporter ATP-binding protein [Thermodesulfobacteriota bacterium]
MSYKLVLPYFKKNKYKVAAGISFLLVVDFFQLLIPYFIKKSIDVITQNNGDFQIVVKYGAMIILSGIVITFLRYWWRVFLIGTSRYIEKGIRQSLFEHVMNLDLRFFDRIKTGDIMAHATSDINHIRMAFGIGVVAFTDAVLLGTATVIIMFYFNFKLAFLALIPMPFIVAVTRVLGRKMHDYHTDAQSAFSVLTENIRESFFGIRIIKVFNFEKLVNKKIDYYSSDYFRKSLKRAIITSAIRPLMILFLNISLFIITFYGGMLVIKGEITPGDLVAFIQYLSLLAWPVIALGWMTNLVQRGAASLKRLNNILTAKPDVYETKNPEFLNNKIETIEYENVSFSYKKSKTCLNHISFTVKKGEFIGFTGRPGSGKSTLLSTVPRLYDPDSGQILINKTDIKNISLKDLRNKIAYMPQEAFLFSGTIKENILLGETEDEEKIKKVIKASCLDETIKNMPAGLNTFTGERGVSLSGGQKQRIALARTLYNEKEIIVLDDPVSQVDTDTALNIIKNLIDITHNKILIIASHRISAVSGAEKIFVMENGRIEDYGNHEYLVKNNIFYKTSCNIQFFKEYDE